MAKVVFVLPGVDAKVFTGGILTLCEYANGLAALGHSVEILPLGFAEQPEWISAKFTLGKARLPYSKSSLFAAVLARDRMRLRQQVMEWLRARTDGYLLQRSLDVELLRNRIPECDAIIATSFETALAVYKYGIGRRYYFMQHFEPLFSSERNDSEMAKLDALSTYFLPGMKMIANSSWLAGKVVELTSKDVPVCLNAISQQTFFPNPEPPASRPFTVISYGGRNAKWKGFEEAARAVQEARKSLPDLEWHVYGTSLLPPDNQIAPYKALGFLHGDQLRTAYQAADVCLAPSWYESFPLYPLEAMACGCCVISTEFGVEDYAAHRLNSIVVKPHDWQSMASALLELAVKPELRAHLRVSGIKTGREFTWARSSERMSALLGL